MAVISAGFALAALAAWAGAGGWLSVIDWRTRLLPTRVIWAAAGAVWVLYSAASLIESDPAGLVGAVVGGLGCGAALAAVHFAHPPSLGFGDVRLGVLNGLMLGWWGWQAAVAGLAAGFVLALPQAVWTLIREGARTGKPLGPYLVAGSAVAAARWAATDGLVPFG